MPRRKKEKNKQELPEVELEVSNELKREAYDLFCYYVEGNDLNFEFKHLIRSTYFTKKEIQENLLEQEQYAEYKSIPEDSRFHYPVAYEPSTIYENEYKALLIYIAYPGLQSVWLDSPDVPITPHEMIINELSKFDLELFVTKSNRGSYANERDYIALPLNQPDIIDKLTKLAESTYKNQVKRLKEHINGDNPHVWYAPKDLDGNLLDKELTAEMATNHFAILQAVTDERISKLKEEVKKAGGGHILEAKLRQRAKGQRKSDLPLKG